jgi:dolichol-phosphate mannosyltransferase
MVHYTVLVPGADLGQACQALLAELSSMLGALSEPHEVICVDTGWSPPTGQTWQPLLRRYDWLRVLRLDRPWSTSAAVTAGIAAARGEVIAAIEASGQYPASEIRRLTARLARADVVFGCRRRGRLARALRWPTRVVRRLLLGLEIRDPDCLLWAARREAVAGLKLADGMHRLMCVLVGRRGYRVGEYHVEHHPRRQTSWRGAKAIPGQLWLSWWLRRGDCNCAFSEIVALHEPGPQVPTPNRHAA